MPANLIALRASNGQYVCAEGSGGREVVANRGAIGPWETFALEDLGNGNVALQAENGQYVCAEGSGGREVVANRDVIGPWETFALEDLGNGNVALRASNGQYVCAEGSGGREVVANRGAIGPWETFERVDLGSRPNRSLLARGRFKRWTNIPLFGTKSDEVFCIKLPQGAKLLGVHIGEIDEKSNVINGIGTEMGNNFTGARLTGVIETQSVVSVCSHWWFNGLNDVRYTLAVWVEGPQHYEMQVPDNIRSLNMDAQILQQIGNWLRDNWKDVATVAARIVGEVFNGDATKNEALGQSFVEPAAVFTQVPK